MEQSSILSEQELQMLASASHQQQYNTLRIYSYNRKIKLDDNPLYFSYSIEQLIFMLKISPRGGALILPASIELDSKTDRDTLINLLTHRTDIRVFWLGPLPSMDTNLPIFVHCADEQELYENISIWKKDIKLQFTKWIAEYPVAFITEDGKHKKLHQANLKSMGLANICYFNNSAALTEINKQKLLIIDLEAVGIQLLDILKGLSNSEKFPIIIIYGDLARNVCHSTYTLVETKGFPVLASLPEIPDKKKWEKLFSTLFSRVYLKHWVDEENIEVGAHKIYNLDNDSVTSHFCPYGMTKSQIAALPKSPSIRHIISAKSIKDWYPEGLQRSIREPLAVELHCNPYNLDICIEYPENVLPNSLFFSTLVMARLAQSKVYWLLQNENNLLSDFLKSLPISDIILSESLSLKLLTDAPDALLEFIQHAQLQQINIIASLTPSTRTREGLALYGIESVLSM
ncbi:hypothetical protein GCM10007916_22120 [Psychromonas marina]|uniref:Uncharacterized protein n=1 Tax=Psychromonas marina TaxID=88364 RepID=A0ABQ6E179_9GAMM|nr:hypothetical protein [Psychromonas marina]GLS91143.1 hypothetical protein GCM10007916_22120 [Psychromonas marina]